MQFKQSTFLALVAFGLSTCLYASSALPNSISDLVESSAPAVVNITSRKEVKMRQTPRGFDEFERFV